ncbi:facilitated trehalose transporter Tret1-like [Frankliniella occidentalis]|uniref:Facilitated trehalose transporter Tret1-like n=1 Tax=Frankliniella occidentalis TaxID=133901 RepID=A0A9C6UCV6_FRAOC|nr:facilitated trehalose transporter Tret1-like [Frankliniella occidentalis]XP_052126908.1 facilitated trehalose transporter Tret1-like [Frankliniella occidentalis]XP_052126909.1 facilitated trehalose transporter Tret1-like [Frankliniella occidentalis]
MDEKTSLDGAGGAIAVIMPKSPTSYSRPPAATGISWRAAVPQVVASVAALSLTLHAGVNMAFPAIMIPQLEAADGPFKIDRDSASWIAAVVAVTTPMGSLAAGPIMDWAGRRAACLAAAAPLVLAWLLLPLAAGVFPGVGLVYVSRALAGIGAGLSTAAGVYVSEVAHPSLRPALLCLNSVFVAAGILLTACMGAGMPWSWMGVVFAGVAAASGVAVVLLAPESPHWLLSMAPGQQLERRTALARQALHRLNKDERLMEASWDRLVASSSAAARKDPQADAEGERLLPHRRLRGVAAFLEPATAKPMLILSVLFILQQLSGTYVIIFYAVPLFAEMGSRVGTSLDEFGVMVIMSVVRFIMSLVTALLSHRFGRRPMLIVSGLGMAACSVAAGATLVTAHGAPILARNVSEAVNGTTTARSVLSSGEVFEASWPPLAFVVLFVLFSSIGYLVMPWTLVSELLPLASRGMGSGLLVSLAYLFMFGVVKSFPYTMATIGARNVFYLFGGMACVATVFVFFCLPETLGRSLGEIEAIFVKKPEEKVEKQGKSSAS